MYRFSSLRSALTIVATAAMVFAWAPAHAQAPSLPEFRTFDGTGNNPDQPDWGAAGTVFQRFVASDYADGVGQPHGEFLPAPRHISNACADQAGSVVNDLRGSHYVWQWGQFIDHDIALTPIAEPGEPLHIAVPMGDEFFDPDFTGTQIIPFMRSNYVMLGGIREQTNHTTSYIDGSMVYGPSDARALALRTLDGTGRLKTSAQDLLPFNVDGLPNEPTPFDPGLFVAGDVRCNEQVGLTALHTLFVREHNYQVERLALQWPGLSGDELYELARAIVVGELQAITYREFLPKLLGPNPLKPYDGYTFERADNANIFAAAAFRVGHTLLPSVLPRMDAGGQEIPEGHLSLSDAFFDPQHILDVGIDSVLRGLSFARAEEVDALVVDDIRNFLFGDPGQGGLDLASLNLQRGRDHGLPRYNEVRRQLGLKERRSFNEVSTNPEVVVRLAAVYDSVEDVDLWLGGLCEDHLPDTMVGELFHTIIQRQFRLFRDGDRFWYEKYLPTVWVEYVEQQTLATIIRRNTDIGLELSDDVFSVPAIMTAADLPLGDIVMGAPYPNPTFGRVSAIVNQAPQAALPVASVFDLRGRRVASPRLVPASSGALQLNWDGRDFQGHRLGAGTYMIVVGSNDRRISRKVVLLD